MRIRTTMLVVPLLVVELAACGQPAGVVVKVGTAQPVPARTVPGLDVLGRTPVTPETDCVRLS
ncbi:hypothetical protein OHS18_37890 [Amycolatopsis sp. NBC_00355]|uniref:hypothetical protein n=1 Tax=Amycolatopsis sp. NBC_00355 TaxID=2975957 RepID=UPI002E26CE10